MLMTRHAAIEIIKTHLPAAEYPQIREAVQMALAALEAEERFEQTLQKARTTPPDQFTTMIIDDPLNQQRTTEKQLRAFTALLHDRDVTITRFGYFNRKTGKRIQIDSEGNRTE